MLEAAGLELDIEAASPLRDREDFVESRDALALNCTVAEMRARGAGFLKIPENYYNDIEAKYDLDAATMTALRDNQILYDREGDGEFFQIYTHIFDERFFFEIVERRHYHGFGAANAAIRLAAQAREVRPLNIPRV